MKTHRRRPLGDDLYYAQSRRHRRRDRRFGADEDLQATVDKWWKAERSAPARVWTKVGLALASCTPRPAEPHALPVSVRGDRSWRENSSAVGVVAEPAHAWTRAAPNASKTALQCYRIKFHSETRVEAAFARPVGLGHASSRRGEGGPCDAFRSLSQVLWELHDVLSPRPRRQGNDRPSRRGDAVGQVCDRRCRRRPRDSITMLKAFLIKFRRACSRRRRRTSTRRETRRRRSCRGTGASADAGVHPHRNGCAADRRRTPPPGPGVSAAAGGAGRCTDVFRGLRGQPAIVEAASSTAWLRPSREGLWLPASSRAGCIRRGLPRYHGPVAGEPQDTLWRRPCLRKEHHPSQFATWMKRPLRRRGRRCTDLMTRRRLLAPETQVVSHAAPCAVLTSRVAAREAIGRRSRTTTIALECPRPDEVADRNADNRRAVENYLTVSVPTASASATTAATASRSALPRRRTAWTLVSPMSVRPLRIPLTAALKLLLTKAATRSSCRVGRRADTAGTALLRTLRRSMLRPQRPVGAPLEPVSASLHRRRGAVEDQRTLRDA